MTESNEKIVPHLWYDKEAKEAVEFYTSIFPQSEIKAVTPLHGTPSGDSEIITFELWGQKFMAISAGPFFQLNPSVSFVVHFDIASDKGAPEKMNAIWKQLSEDGTVLMPLEKYPFSEKYGWIQDKYGLSWQLMLVSSQGEKRQTIIPSLLFVGKNCGRAEEAMNFYLSVFKNSKPGHLARYPKDMEPNKEGSIMFSDFQLENQWFIAMDSGLEHNFNFNEALSFLVYCETQEEIDYYWERLSAVPEAEQCGWLKDKFGLSWQITTREMDEMMQHGTPEQLARLTKAFLQMKKFNLEELRRAYRGE